MSHHFDAHAPNLTPVAILTDVCAHIVLRFISSDTSHHEVAAFMHGVGRIIKS